VNESLKVILHQAGEQHWFGFMAEPEPAHAPIGQGWLGRLHHRFQAAIQTHLTAPDRPLGKVLHWLRRRIHPDESLLRHLRTASEVVVEHPPHVSGEATAAHWAQFLTRAERRHFGWLLADLAISPLTLLLIPLPGPNVVGFWVCFRVVCHILAWRGAVRAARGCVAVRFQASEVLELTSH
jgi:hypothetical protein